MYLIKSVTFNFARRMVFISMIVIGTIKDIIRIVLYPPSLALRLITKPFKRRRFKRYKPSHKRTYADEFMKRRYDDDFIVVDDNPGDKPGLNHKHDNYQSQIDGFHRKVNELLLNDEAYNKQFNRLEKEVTSLTADVALNANLKKMASEDRINNRLDKLEANVKSIDETDCSGYFNDKIEALEDDYKYLNGRMDKLRQTSGFVLSINSSLKSLKEKVETIQHYHIDNDISTKIEALEAKVDKLLSENSELTFKPLTKEEEVSLDDLQARLEMSEGEAQWYKDGEEHYKRIAKDEYAEHKANYPDEPDSKPDRWGLTKKQREEFRNGVYKRAMGEDVKKYPSEPNFNAEKEAMDKQMAKVAERDDK